MNSLAQMLRKVRAVVQRRGVAPEDVEDIVQEAFLRIEIYERTHVVRSKEAMLVRAAVNISADAHKRRKRAPFSEDQAVEAILDLAPAADETLRVRERLERVSDGLAAMNERTRRILLARRLDGLRFEQIAQQEGMSVAAVEKQVARATLFLIKWADGW